ncbi:MAG: hypothetical protein EAX96_08865 [Candidatus Lokiarchaeota archaeon]|nr:hypothetical protein [Candidatus Lokiarchaeota archaeon]
MALEFLEILGEVLGLIVNSRKKGKKKESDLGISCPICNQVKLTDDFFCSNCNTHIILEENTNKKSYLKQNVHPKHRKKQEASLNVHNQVSERKKEAEIKILCPICNQVNLSEDYFCSFCNTHVVTEELTKNEGDLRQMICPECGSIQEEASLNDYCQRCGEKMIIKEKK